MAEPTTYVVLRRLPDGPAWILEASNVVAPSAVAAIRAAAEPPAGMVDVSGPTEYVAVPARSWRPVKVTAVQTTNLKLEQP